MMDLVLTTMLVAADRRIGIEQHGYPFEKGALAFSPLYQDK